MKTEQFNQLQTICTLDGLCYSLDSVADEIGDGSPDELAIEVVNLREALQSFQAAVEKYVLAHKDDYIDKEESI